MHPRIRTLFPCLTLALTGLTAPAQAQEGPITFDGFPTLSCYDQDDDLLRCTDSVSLAEFAIEEGQETYNYGTLGGSVFDEHAVPIHGAVVRVSGPSVSQALTDAEGRFYFSVLPQGSYDLEAWHPAVIPQFVENVPVLDDARTGLAKPLVTPRTGPLDARIPKETFISDDGLTFAAWFTDGGVSEVRIWRTEAFPDSPRPVARYEDVSRVSMSSQGHLALVLGDPLAGELRLFDGDDEAETCAAEYLVDGDSMAWSPDGTRLVYVQAGSDGVQLVVRNHHGSQELRSTKASAIAFDGSTLTQNANTVVWAAETAGVWSLLRREGGSTQSEIARDIEPAMLTLANGSVVFLTPDDRLSAWQPTGLITILGILPSLDWASASDDRSTIAFVTHSPTGDPVSLMFWREGDAEPTVVAREAVPDSLAVSPDGRMIVYRPDAGRAEAQLYVEGEGSRPLSTGAQTEGIRFLNEGFIFCRTVLDVPAPIDPYALAERFAEINDDEYSDRAAEEIWHLYRHEILLWRSGSETLLGPGECSSLEVSPDHTQIAFVDDPYGIACASEGCWSGGNLWRWDLDRMESRLLDTDGYLSSIAFSPDSEHVSWVGYRPGICWPDDNDDLVDLHESGRMRGIGNTYGRVRQTYTPSSDVVATYEVEWSEPVGDLTEDARMVLSVLDIEGERRLDVGETLRWLAVTDAAVLYLRTGELDPERNGFYAQPLR